MYKAKKVQYALNSQLQALQILTNHDEVENVHLTSFLLAALSKHCFINHLILASFNEQLIMIVTEEKLCLKIEHLVSKLYKIANYKTSPFTP